MLTLSEVLSELGIEASFSQVEEGWEASADAAPAGPLPFLNDDFIHAACRYIGADGATETALQAAAARVAGSAPLRMLLWHAHCRLYRQGPGISGWPELEGALGPDAGLFYVLALLSNYPGLKAFHEAHKIPAGVAADTLSDIPWHMEAHRRKTGHYGLLPIYAGGWLAHHMRGSLYRLGRLQFMPGRFPKGLRVFRRDDGSTVGLAEEGMVFRSDGQYNGASGVTETEGVWTAAFALTETEAASQRISPETGAALRETVRLPLSRWRPALQPGDPVLDIHIPAAGGPLTPAECGESVRRAMEFFPRHFPERPGPRALVCTTWMLDAQLGDYLPEEANILRFQRQFHLFAAHCDPWAAFRSVFELEIPYGSTESPALDTLPARTRLERALIAHVKAGKRWRKAGGFVLAEDLPWGRRAYRK